MHFFARQREKIRQSSMSSRLLWPSLLLVVLLVLTLAVQAGRWHSDGWWSQSYAGPRLQQVLAYALPYGGGLGGAAGWDWQRWVPGPS